MSQGRAGAGDSEWYLDVALPALLRHARGTFSGAIRRGLADAGFDDMPRNGVYVVGGMARNGDPAGVLVADMGLPAPAAGRLIDELVARGYLALATDPAGSARPAVVLTDRGHAAADVSRSVIESLESELVAQVGAEAVGHARATLAALAHLGRRAASGHAVGDDPA